MTSRSWLAPMRARDTTENHRVATPLELFFDLCFVVAVAQAATPLHHAIAEGHIWHGVEGYLQVFFAVWWAWMNFTWFASAYDTDDDVYRITTLVQIGGALVLAAGVADAFDANNYTAITIGYVIMRLAMVAQWIRAARGDRERRTTAIYYAVGIVVVQILWLLRLALPEDLLTPAFAALVVCELLVPVLAERSPGGSTAPHPHHIAERYGLFTIIMLGESVSAATIAIRTGLDTGEHEAGLVSVAAAGLVIVFGLWWLYFDRSAHSLIRTLHNSELWGYGHYFIFAAAAAVGAGIAVEVEYESHHAEISGTVAAYAVAVPVAVYLLVVWLLHIRPHQRGPFIAAYPFVAVLTLLAPLGPAPVFVIAALMVLLVTATVVVGRRVPDAIAQ
ncbi:low temperature requirement protein A [Winogradskya consettensis]|uniref:Membrane protein n=1 Tax=Winogradskya consettensis TaxID=113560 RepID=A0A919S8N5_9ACTN|nr:low temperature requirement protein A [Actinoplanes consettensis]GIM66740.1 membrane protein [Actinoplanes consettensis]